MAMQPFAQRSKKVAGPLADQLLKKWLTNDELVGRGWVRGCCDSRALHILRCCRSVADTNTAAATAAHTTGDAAAAAAAAASAAPAAATVASETAVLTVAALRLS
jgi:hypothetical protein